MHKKSLFIRTILLIIGSILFINAMSLIIQKKIHLGIFIPLCVGSIFIIHALFWQRIHIFLRNHKTLRFCWRLLWIGFFIWLLSFFAFAWTLKQNISRQSSLHTPIQAIIVLGSGIEGDQPTPTLAKRLDTTAEVAHIYPTAFIVVSGGIGFNKQISEAEVMSNYLQKQHQIIKDRILTEGKSTSTELNLKNSIPILQAHQISQHDPIAIVTSDFHTLRSHAIATKQGYTNIVMIGAPTPLTIRYNAWLREYFAFVSGWVLQEY